MKRFCFAVVLAALPFAMLAQDRTGSYTHKVTGGSVTITNKTGSIANGNASLSDAMQLRRISFAVPSATFTNTATLTHVRTIRLPDVTTTVVTTNAVTLPNGSTSVETNTPYYAQAPVTFTNSYTLAVTTNDTSVQFFDRDDFGDGLTLESGDAATYSFTYTNALYLIHVYDLIPRP